jgi:hypothetical protein
MTVPYTSHQQQSFTAADGVSSAVTLSKTCDEIIIYNKGTASLYFNFDAAATVNCMKISPGGYFSSNIACDAVYVMGDSGSASGVVFASFCE